MNKPPERQIKNTTELAAYLGLARSTVSRVLNKHDGLRAETVARVQQALKEIHFAPNPYPRILLRGKSDTFGIMLRHLDQAVPVRKVAALQQFLRARELNVLIEPTSNDPARIDAVVRHFIAMRVNAVVLVGAFGRDLTERILAPLRARGIPTAATDEVGVPEIEHVVVQRSWAMQKLTEHLLDLGHREFGLLGIRPHAPHNDVRLRGIHQAFKKRGLDPEKHIRPTPEMPPHERSFRCGQHLGRAWLDRVSRPTAFLALNDEIAVGAMIHFQRNGLRIPEDISIVGFDDSEAGEVMFPALTTVDARIEDAAAATIDCLLRLGENHSKQPARKTIRPRLIFRESTGPSPRS